MKYVNLGKTGVKVSQLCFGTMSFGAEVDEEMSGKMFHKCRDAGINFFDCADVYSDGTAEEILGKLMTDCRNEIVLATKVCGPMGDDVNAKGLSRRHIFEAVEASLKRLKTDRIDIYFAHRFDPDTDLEQTLYAFDDLVRSGKILYTAVSNWAAYQIATALGISREEKIAEFVCIQPMYNLAKRQAEVELLPLAETENLAVVPFSPLGGGLLTGKYGIDKKPVRNSHAGPGFPSTASFRFCNRSAYRRSLGQYHFRFFLFSRSDRRMQDRGPVLCFRF